MLGPSAQQATSVLCFLLGLSPAPPPMALLRGAAGKRTGAGASSVDIAIAANGIERIFTSTSLKAVKLSRPDFVGSMGKSSITFMPHEMLSAP